MSDSKIDSLEGFLSSIRNEYRTWPTPGEPWFRGEPECDTPLLPKLYRKPVDREPYVENSLVQLFRIRAPALITGTVPGRSEDDLWLFLMQHFRLPTRLLDWTESALIALHFALQEEEAVVWMLNPLDLNFRSAGERKFLLTHGTDSAAVKNIQGAWDEDNSGVDLPVSIHPTVIHPRMHAQRSCFTIHGKKKQGLNNLIPDLLKKYVIDTKYSKEMLVELRILGISESTIFPDLEGLSREIINLK